MQRLGSLFWFVCLSVGFLGVGIVSAQSTPASPVHDVVSFVVDGKTHSLRYPESDASVSTTIQSAVAAIVPVYEKFWNAPPSGSSSMDFRLFIDVGLPQGDKQDPSDVKIESVALPEVSSPWNGHTASKKTKVCQVQLFDKADLYATVQRLQFEVALDLAQCYIDHYGDPPAHPDDWWFKGISYWMAVQVYPPPPAVLTVLSKKFNDNYNQDLLNANEEALYFWEFLLGSGLPSTLKSMIPGSLPDVVNGLKNLSGTVTFFTPDLFYAWAQAVAANHLAWQPTPDSIAQDEKIFDFPDDVKLELEENSIVIETVALPSLKSDEGIDIQAKDLSDNGVIASISAGGQGTFTLSDGASVRICNPPTSLTLVAGRGPKSSVPDASLTVSKVEHCTTTPEPTPEVTEQTGLPACVVGTWSIRFPFLERLLQFSGGTWQFTFNNNGSFELTANNLIMQNRGVNLQFNYDYKGTIALVPDASTPNRFNVSQFSVQLQPGAQVLVVSNGNAMDMTPLYINGNQLAAPPAFITCASSGTDNPTVNYYATPQYPVILTRIVG